MTKYWVEDNPQSNGDHEVHREDCEHLKYILYKTYLGEFDDCKSAMEEANKAIESAKKRYPFSTHGCPLCMPRCAKEKKK